MELYKKYRPASLDEVVGNQAVVKSISSMLENKKDIPHALLFTGPSGSGKTTMARILKTALNCSDGEYHEIDSAQFTGVDHVRSLRMKMNYAPATGDCRVYLLDEVHRMSSAAQDALLKALEDCPKHVYFFLATTDPQKLLKTVKTRCTSFEMQALTPAEIGKDLLLPTCKKEGKQIPKEALKTIARECNGSARLAMVLLNSIINMEPEDMEEAIHHRAEEESELIALCRALLNQAPWAQIAKNLKGLSQEPESCRRGILNYMMSVVLSGGPKAHVAYNTMLEFESNYYDTAKAGLVMSCYAAIHGE